jgi:hypothetical protein
MTLPANLNDDSNARTKTLLVVVTSDPRSSHRPAEAIRLAAGVAAWRNVAVTLYLAGPAVGSVTGEVENFIDEESFTRYLPLFVDSGNRVLIGAESFPNGKSSDTSVPCESIDKKEFGKIAAATSCLLRF